MNPNLLADINYSCWTQGMDLKTLKGCGITLLSHIWTHDPEDMKRYLEEAHALGIKVLPYLSPEKAWSVDTPERLKAFIDRNKGCSPPYYQCVDPGSHPEWILIDKFGRPSPRYGSYAKKDPDDREVIWGIWEAHGQKYQDQKNPSRLSWYMCSSAEGYLEAVERGARALMDIGFDGIFIDNIYTKRLAICYGEELGIHKHRPPGDNTDKSYLGCTERIYHAVKSYGQEKIVLLNGGRENVYSQVRDGCMIESYIATSGTGERRHNWEKVLEWAEEHRNEVKKGRFVAALSYIQPTARYTARENCFYTFACALLSGFKWTAMCPDEVDQVRLLYRARLLEPRGDTNKQGALWVRQYERGAVFVNPDHHHEFNSWFTTPPGVRHPVELYSGRRLPVKDGKVLISVPQESGRVVVELRDAINNHLVECAANLRQAANELERHPDRSEPDIPPIWGDTWQDVADKALKDAEFLESIPAEGEKSDTRTGEVDRALELLGGIHSWSTSTTDDPFGSAFRVAGEHAYRGASLISGLELSFLQNPLRLFGMESEVKLVLTNHNHEAYHIGTIRLHPPEGWEAVPSDLELDRTLEAGELIEFSSSVRIPAGNQGSQGLVIAIAEARSIDNRTIPCGAICVAMDLRDRSEEDESEESPTKGELEMPG